MPTVKQPLVALFVVLLMSGCQGRKIEELERQKLELAKEKADLRSGLEERERRIIESFTTLTEINEQLASVDQAIVALQPQEQGVAGKAAAVTDATRQHIENIRSQIDEKIKKIDELTEKNKKAGVRIASLNAKIKAMIETLAQKQADIDAMVIKIEGLNQTVSSQGVTIETQKQDIGKREQEVREHKERIVKLQEDMERVWYVAGTEDQLSESQVLREEGGLIFGWGAVLMLNTPVSDEKFTPSSVLTTEINVPGVIESLIPSRGPDTYRIEPGPQGTKVIILKPDLFWQDRYLVLLAE